MPDEPEPETAAEDAANLEGSAPTTALALRAPAGLAKPASLYPEGHADSATLATVVGSGPALALAAGAVGAALLGPPGIMFGAIAMPVGWFGTNWLFSSRGKAQLAQALALRIRDRAAGNAALESIAASRRWLPEVRVEAAGLLAQDAIERGDFAEAIRVLDFDEGDRRLVRRRRSWETGCRGEVLRSILAWLSPGSFAEGGVVASAAFPEPRDHTEGIALLAALRLLEAAGQTDDGRLAAAWQDLQGTALPVISRTLDLITTAVAADRLHEMVDDLYERLRNDPDGRQRALLRRLFPRMQLPGDAGYRGVSVDIVDVSDEPGSELNAPDEITALAVVPEHAMAPVSRAPVATIFAGVYGTLLGSGIILGTIAGGPIGAILGGMVAMMLGIYATPIPVLIGSRTIEEKERVRRVAPLMQLHPRLPRSWLTEIATGPPGRIENSSGYRRLPEIPRSQMILHVAVAKAEHALYEGDLDAAWHHVEWWFAGARGRIPSNDPMFAAGGSLLRIATLTGHFEQAERLSSLLEPVDKPWDDMTRRTAYGNATRALALARALLAARQGKWEIVATQFDWAVRHRPIWVASHDQALYLAVAKAAQARGVAVRIHGLRDDGGWEAWIGRVFPEGRPT